MAKQLNLPKPQSWEDLTNPVYKGHIAMPNPASSGTGYMQVSAWLQNMGEDKAWDYMQRLDQNIAHYTHSGSKPCVQAGMGEVAIGISMATRGAKLKTQGAPLDVIVPNGIGWESEAVGSSKKVMRQSVWSIGLSRKRQMSCILRAILSLAIRTSASKCRIIRMLKK